MQSVYKLPIGMAVLQRVDEGTLKLEQLIQVTTNDFVTNMQHSPIRDAHPLGAETQCQQPVAANGFGK